MQSIQKTFEIGAKLLLKKGTESPADLIDLAKRYDLTIPKFLSEAAAKTTSV